MRTHLGSKGIKERQLQASKEQHNKQVSVDGFFFVWERWSISADGSWFEGVGVL